MYMDKNKIAVDVFNKLADLYQSKFMDVSMYHDTFDIFCNVIKKQDAKLLELACGPGNITKYLLTKRPYFKILGTDLAPNMLELAKVNNPQAQFALMDARLIVGLEEKYDALMCGFILPYLSKEEAEKMIIDASKILNQGGVIYISTMEDDYSKSGYKKGSTGDEIYMYFHQADYLVTALKKYGFEIIEEQRKTYQMQENVDTIDLILIAKKA